MKILTLNAGLMRITPVDISMIKWKSAWEETARGLPELISAMTASHSWLAPLRSVAKLINYPLWSLAPWIDQRAEALPAALRNIDADIICLQEVFETAHRDHILHDLQDIYPYHAINLTPCYFGLNDGLIILSRHPIADAQFTPFHTAPLEEGMLMNRGTLVARIDMPAYDSITVINTHITAAAAFRNTYGTTASLYRQKQLEELILIIDTLSNQHRIILAGDFNCGPQHGSTGYHFLLKANFKDLFTEAKHKPEPQNSITFDSRNNPLNKSCDETIEPPERIDHIFAHTKGPFTAKAAHIVLKEKKIKATEAERIPVSDHYGVSVEINISPG